MARLFKLTGWRIFRPALAPWGESTGHWTEVDWGWFRSYRPMPGGIRPLTADEIAASGRYNDPQ